VLKGELEGVKGDIWVSFLRIRFIFPYGEIFLGCGDEWADNDSSVG